MRVEQFMTEAPACCTPEDDVEVAAEIMKRLDTGIVPVTQGLSQPSTLLGVITDRDLCLGVIAAGGERTSIRVGELMSTKLTVCRPSDTGEQVVARMRPRYAGCRLLIVSLNSWVWFLSVISYAIRP